MNSIPSRSETSIGGGGFHPSLKSRIVSVSSRLAAIGLVWSFAFFAHAAGVVCPVCGQTIDEGTPVCPNDGTDLRLLGKPRDEKDTEPVPTETDSNPGTDNGKTISTSEPEGSGGYKRHDDIGSRKIKEEDENKRFLDRRSRLPKDSRTQTQVRKKRVEPKSEPPPPVEEKDKHFFADYERKRKFVWEEREKGKKEAKEAAESRRAARDKLLHSLAAPITSLGARIFFLGEGKHAGPTLGAEIDLHLARYKLRAGLSTFLGIRALPTRNELVFLEGLSVGAQLPARYSPFAVVRGGVGMVASERFYVNQYYLMTAVGAEIGIDAWVHPWLSISPSVGYLRCTVDNAYWHTFTAKLAVGF